MSNNLGLSQIAATQNNKHVTANDQVGQLDAALTGILSVEVDDTNAASLTTEQLRRHFFFDIDPDATPPDGAVTITVPAIQRGLFAMRNNTAQEVTVAISGQSLTAPAIGAGEAVLLSNDGTDVRAEGSGAGGGAAAFTDLTDAFASYSGLGGRHVRVKASEDGLEASDEGVASFIGVLVQRDTDLEIASSTGTFIPWESAVYDTGFNGHKFWLGPDAEVTADAGTDAIALTSHGMVTGDGPFQLTTDGTLPGGLSAATDYWCIEVDDDSFQVATSYADAIAGSEVDITDTGTGTHTIERAARLVIPDGITKVRIRGNVRWESDATMTGVRGTSAFLNDGSVAGLGADTKVPSGGNDQVNVSSAVYEVSVGDFLALNCFQSSGGGLDVTAHPRTWLALEVVEPLAGTGDRTWDFGFAKAATPTSGEVLNKVVVPRTIVLPADLSGAAGHVDTNPTAQFDIDMTVDNVSIGTISIAADGTFTFTTSGGTVQALTAGSVVRFVAPASTDATVAGIAATLVASLP